MAVYIPIDSLKIKRTCNRIYGILPELAKNSVKLSVNLFVCMLWVFFFKWFYYSPLCFQRWQRGKMPEKKRRLPIWLVLAKLNFSENCAHYNLQLILTPHTSKVRAFSIYTKFRAHAHTHTPISTKWRIFLTTAQKWTEQKKGTKII